MSAVFLALAGVIALVLVGDYVRSRRNGAAGAGPLLEMDGDTAYQNIYAPELEDDPEARILDPEEIDLVRAQAEADEERVRQTASEQEEEPEPELAQDPVDLEGPTVAATVDTDDPAPALEMPALLDEPEDDDGAALEPEVSGVRYGGEELEHEPWDETPEGQVTVAQLLEEDLEDEAEPSGDADETELEMPSFFDEPSEETGAEVVSLVQEPEDAGGEVITLLRGSGEEEPPPALEVTGDEMPSFVDEVELQVDQAEASTPEPEESPVPDPPTGPATDPDREAQRQIIRELFRRRVAERRARRLEAERLEAGTLA
jgi:hypothetical protein